MGGRYGHQLYTVVIICCILVIGVSVLVTRLDATAAPRAWAASVHHSLAFSTYLGDQYGAANALAHDGAGNVHLGGDGYFIKFAPAGSALMHVRFSGVVNGIAVDRQDNIYITGYTEGFSTRHAFQAQPGGGEDAFVAKFNRFNRHGLAALSIAAGRGRHPTYDPGARGQIVATAQAPPDRKTDGTATWSLSALQKRLRKEGLEQIGTNTIKRVLEDAGSSYQKTRSWCPTGTAQRVRKSGVVTVTDPETEQKRG